MKKAGFTMIELLLTIGVSCLLLLLVLPAILKIRIANVKFQSINNIRQIGIAMANYENGKGRFPGFVNMSLDLPYQPDEGTLLELSPFLNLPFDKNSYSATNPSEDPVLQFKQIISPADPSLAYYPGKYPINVSDDATWEPGNTSYAPNAYALKYGTNPARITDGTSNTIQFAEHYARCGNSLNSNFVFYWQPYLVSDNEQPHKGRVNAFAYPFKSMGDVFPIISELGTRSSRNTASFQLAPHPQDCDPTIPQSPHRDGMIVLMFDTSVRTITSRIPSDLFWSTVTPASNDSILVDY